MKRRSWIIMVKVYCMAIGQASANKWGKLQALNLASEMFSLEWSAHTANNKVAENIQQPLKMNDREIQMYQDAGYIYIPINRLLGNISYQSSNDSYLLDVGFADALLNTNTEVLDVEDLISKWNLNFDTSVDFSDIKVPSQSDSDVIDSNAQRSISDSGIDVSPKNPICLKETIRPAEPSSKTSSDSKEKARYCVGSENFQLDVKSFDEAKVDVKSLDKALDEVKFYLKDLLRNFESARSDRSNFLDDFITKHNLVTLICDLEITFIRECYNSKEQFSRNGPGAKAKAHYHPVLDAYYKQLRSKIRKSLRKLKSNVKKFQDPSLKLTYISEICCNLNPSTSIHLRWPKTLRKNFFDINSFLECLIARVLMYKHSYEQISEDMNAVLSEDIRSPEDFKEKLPSLRFFFVEFNILITIIHERYENIKKIYQGIGILAENEDLFREKGDSFRKYVKRLEDCRKCILLVLKLCFIKLNRIEKLYNDFQIETGRKK
ncbi:hypothetical protein TNCV_2340801 [Trichonephila clavipes]|nr:hypothetical protein TNCV_2340801 [Trichonephila clavipes]